VESESITQLVANELAAISDATLLARIRALLVTPYAVTRDWDYGAPGDALVCWTVLEHAASNTGIAYCSEGFGPSHPWGLVFLLGPHMSIGMDAGWYRTLEAAMRDSMAGRSKSCRLRKLLMCIGYCVAMRRPTAARD
jgi:hypothetical protein